jgi:hypothetical protein
VGRRHGPPPLSPPDAGEDPPFAAPDTRNECSIMLL